MSLLIMDNVTKSFGDIKAVDGLSFAVEPGEIFGFLGGNGAGKTTSLRMVLDIIRPTSGSIEVLGQAPGKRIAPQLGFLPEERGLYANMTAIDTIVYFGQMKGLSAADARREGLALLERFDLADRAKSPISDMSKGMAQKVQLATSIVNRPRLLILDEPFSGLDPVNQQLLEAEIQRASDDGAAVIFSTHVMQHAERLCDRLLVLKKGRKTFEGTVSQARGLLPSRIEVTATDAIATMPGVRHARRTRDLGEGWADWIVELEPGTDGPDLLETCTRAAQPLRRFDEQRASLHDVFVHLVGEEEAAA
ncbi:ABC transporter ATP-binding protein [Sphingomicrobium flavum]|uniref:ABC transporter ATP-binding protein n=1 Tax=Sphingomicrobium flavum TaxID=1229164 RepID=UPI0021AE313C|nr:ATP-binding cassette domain-containing protein [Sphingomicrobium flavum]